MKLPKILGMGQLGDGGLMASKPYVASGKYIQRMSNYCKGCQFDSAQSTCDKPAIVTGALTWSNWMKSNALSFDGGGAYATMATICPRSPLREYFPIQVWA